MNKLYIDTRDNNRIVVRIDKNRKIFEKISVANKNRAQVALPLIEKILRSAKLALSDIKEINVETGPGSFTGLRVGIAIANALSFAGLIRISGKRIGELEKPQY